MKRQNLNLYSAKFEKKTDSWIKSQKTPWSRLRYEIAFTNIKNHLGKKRLEILDFGGGNGLDALPLARLGHKITIADFSVNMLNEAKKNFRKKNLCASFIFCSSDNINKNLSKKYDLVLCHNVLSYISNPKKLLSKLLPLLKKNGLLSVVQINKYSEVIYPLVFEKNLVKAAKNAAISETQANIFNLPVTRYSPEELIAMVQSLKLKLVKQYGILIASGLITDNKLKYQNNFYKKLKKLELLLTDKYPFYLISRFSQLIFRK